MTERSAQSALRIAFAVLLAAGSALVGVGVVIGQVKTNTDNIQQHSWTLGTLAGEAEVLQDEVQWQGTILELLARKQLGAENLPSRPHPPYFPR